MPDPDIVTDVTGMALTPCEELVVILLGKSVLLPAISGVAGSHAPNWMITWIDARVGRDRTQLSNLAPDATHVSREIAVVIHRTFVHRAVRAQRSICAQVAILYVTAFVNARLLTERSRFLGCPERCDMLQHLQKVVLVFKAAIKISRAVSL